MCREHFKPRVVTTQAVYVTIHVDTFREGVTVYNLFFFRCFGYCHCVLHLDLRVGFNRMENNENRLVLMREKRFEISKKRDIKKIYFELYT